MRELVEDWCDCVGVEAIGMEGAAWRGMPGEGTVTAPLDR